MASVNSAVAAGIATIAAGIFIAAAPEAAAQDQSPAATMARMVCFDEIRAFEAAHAKAGNSAAQTAAKVGDVLKSFVPASEDRTHVLTNTAKIKADLTTASDHAELTFALCAATVGTAADGGMRDLDGFKQRWASAKARSGAGEPAVPAAPAPRPAASSASGASSQLARIARSVCANEIKAYEEDLVRAGATTSGAASAIDDIVRTFTEDAEPRNRVIDSFDAMASQAGGTDADLKKLAASACAATMGSLWSLGMRSSGEFTNHWAGRGRARFALAGHPVQPLARGCIWMEFDGDGMGGPATLRNDCAFTIDLRFCVADARVGTPSETIACEKGRSRFERIEPKSGVRVTLTDGARVNWVPCKSPLQPVETNAAGAPFTATCK